MISFTPVILMAGRGQRLWPITRFFPKPVVPLPDQTLVCSRTLQCMNNLVQKKIVVNIGYLAPVVREHISYYHPDIPVEFIEEMEHFESGGSLIHLTPHVHTNTILCASGDIIASWDLPSFLEKAHDSWKAHPQQKIFLLLRKCSDQEASLWITPQGEITFVPPPEGHPADFANLQLIQTNWLKSQKILAGTYKERILKQLKPNEIGFAWMPETTKWFNLTDIKDLHTFCSTLPPAEKIDFTLPHHLKIVQLPSLQLEDPLPTNQKIIIPFRTGSYWKKYILSHFSFQNQSKDWKEFIQSYHILFCSKHTNTFEYLIDMTNWGIIF